MSTPLPIGIPPSPTLCRLVCGFTSSSTVYPAIVFHNLAIVNGSIWEQQTVGYLLALWMDNISLHKMKSKKNTIVKKYFEVINNEFDSL